MYVAVWHLSIVRCVDTVEHLPQQEALPRRLNIHPLSLFECCFPYVCPEPVLVK